MKSLETTEIQLCIAFDKLLQALELGFGSVVLNKEYFRFDFSFNDSDFSIGINGRGNDEKAYVIPMLEELIGILKAPVRETSK